MMVISCSLQAQDEKFFNKFNNKQHNAGVYNIFKDIENSISKADVKYITKLLNGQTYFSLSNGTSGYYTSNQAYYILEDFFNVYKVTVFRLKSINTGSPNPYATGVYNYEFRGQRSTAQVYIALKPAGKHWRISQITIN